MPEGQRALSDDELDIRQHIYRFWISEGRPPVPLEISASLSISPRSVERSLERLADLHALALIPGSHYLWMATPFSALPTHFEVVGKARAWWANCIWDAVAISPMIGENSLVRGWCGDCGERLELSVEPSRIAADGCVAHFAVSACNWWHDLGFT